MKLLNKDQQEQLVEIVAHLRQVREERSVGLKELAAYTRIQPAILQAMEEGRFEELPEPIYVQGFIRHYANAIGLDGAALAKTVANICLTPEESNNDHQVVDEKPTIYIPLFVPYVLLLGVASFGLFYLLNPQRSVQSSNQKDLSPLAAEQNTEFATQASSLTSSKPKTRPPVTSSTTKALSPALTTITPTPSSALTTITPTPSPQEATTPVEVTLELQDTSWLRVKVDGKTEFEGELKKGDKKTWTAKKEVMVRSGNAGAVLISTNKKQPTPLGSVGSIKQVTFTPETANSQ
ncbi:helix-turn-helix domain-containing protein [Scytonema tolypothrichoides VB-61278]|nr:helix-turn-helix domain-containing protein [Scytonema tolypothrichoides VB-61278]